MNRYSPWVFSGLLIIPLAFCVVHAQDSNMSSDPFDKMFNQAREQSRQKILQDFSQAHQNSPPPFAGAQGAGKGMEQQSQLANVNKSTTASSSNPAAPAASIPTPSVSPTNTGNIPPPPANIYAPSQQSAASPSSTPQPTVPAPQSSTNLYK